MSIFKKMSPLWPTSFRRPLIIGCLVAALVLVVALGYEAIMTAHAQRRVAEDVLHDYATLAAEQYARNVTVTLDYEWFGPTLRLIGSDLTDAAAIDPDTAVAGQRETYRLGDLASGVFTIDDPGTARYLPVGAGERPDVEALVAMVLARAETDYQAGWPYAAFLRAGERDDGLVVYRRSGDASWPIVGFVAGAASLGEFLSRAVTIYDLLPATLTEGAGDDPLVRVRALDGSGATLFAHGPEGAPAIDARVDLDARRAHIGVVASIPAASAAQLVVGGLPYSRLPLVAGMAVLTVALIVAGGLLWRRERELIALREQFLAGASHELRTPLAQIRMFAETLRLQRVRSDEEAERSLEVIDREARRLSVLVENLLQFSNPSSRPRRFVPETLDARRLLREVVQGFEPLAAARAARIETTGDPEASIAVSGDRDMLRQVLVNLLDNAVKYGPRGQTVEVNLRRNGGEAVLTVTDEGTGVPQAERGLVWERFWRGSRADGVTGTGIGLALVRELVELHRGRVAVDAAAGGGARFEVRLPLARS